MDFDLVELYDDFKNLADQLDCRHIAELYREDKIKDGGFEIIKLMNESITLKSKMFTVFITKGVGVSFVAIKKNKEY